jgi:hypothetical protein
MPWKPAVHMPTIPGFNFPDPEVVKPWGGLATFLVVRSCMCVRSSYCALGLQFLAWWHEPWSKPPRRCLCTSVELCTAWTLSKTNQEHIMHVYKI